MQELESEWTHFQEGNCDLFLFINLMNFEETLSCIKNHGLLGKIMKKIVILKIQSEGVFSRFQREQ